MAKKSKKRSKRTKSPGNDGALQPAQLLERFKSFWNTGDYPKALLQYRTWTNKTGTKRDPTVEGELLFRCASYHYARNDYSKALEFLDEALDKGPGDDGRCSFYKALCLAKAGHMTESLRLWDRLGDDFHSLIISRLVEQEQTLPDDPPPDPAIEKTQLLGFWKQLSAGNGGAEIDTINPALKIIARAYSTFLAGGDPEPPLKTLQKKPGFGPLADFLILLSAISRGRKIRVRNIVRKSPVSELIDLHMRQLFKNKEYREIVAFNAMLQELKLRSTLPDVVWDEVYFNLGLEEIESDRLDKAPAFFSNIKYKTRAVMHNTALAYQKTGEDKAANELWKMLLEKEGKPKQTDPAPVRSAYVTSCTYIARNALRCEQPEEARYFFLEVLRFEPENREALEELFFIAYDLGDKRASLDYAGRLYQLEPESSDFFKIYALELERNAEYETLISLYKKKLQHDPEDYFCKSGLVDYYTDRALTLKDEDPVSSKKMMREAKKLSIFPSCRLLYLEGYFLKKEGKKDAARKKFRLAEQEARDHLDEFELGVYFYNDELPEFGHTLFNRIVTCGCEESELLFEKIVKFFIDREDFENAMEICGIRMDRFDYSEADIADLLLYYEKPEWAKIYSTRAVESEDADEEDKHLHLLVLNAIGNKEETLAYLEALREDARRHENPEDVFIYKQMAREVKARGRFKEQ